MKDKIKCPGCGKVYDSDFRVIDQEDHKWQGQPVCRGCIARCV